ncbi:MAG TPA: phage tail protein [Arsenophonus nasoniae]|uniref:phage tail protein n=1 Tax=Arsenophonus nasoniae TaxID=638 RepID=UPI003879E3BD
MILGFGNNVTSRLASDITSSQTTITIDSGSGTIFSRLLNPSINNPDVKHTLIAKITISDIEQTIWEVCHLTAVNGDTLTVVRGQEGTSQRGWNANSLIGNFATKGSEGNFVQIEQLQGGDFTYTTAKGTANDLIVNLPSTYTIDNWDLKSPIVISPINNNTGNVKIQLFLNGFSIGDFPVYKANKNQLIKNDIVAGVPFIVVLDKTKTFFNIINAGSIYDTLQLAQQPGSSTTIPLSQNAVKEYYALKNSKEKFLSGSIYITDLTDSALRLYSTSRDQYWALLFRQSSDQLRIYNDKRDISIIFPQKSGTLALTSDINIPVGSPIPWPQATPPAGYLVCNGQTFNKTNCPQLATVYPSGKLPDLQGQFIRGLDLGGNVDRGRTVLSAQGDAIRNIKGRIGYARRGGSEPPVIDGEGVFRRDSNYNGNIGYGQGDNWASVMSFDASRSVPTANENRPVNVAFLYIVRAA